MVISFQSTVTIKIEITILPLEFLITLMSWQRRTYVDRLFQRGPNHASIPVEAAVLHYKGRATIRDNKGFSSRSQIVESERQVTSRRSWY